MFIFVLKISANGVNFCNSGPSLFFTNTLGPKEIRKRTAVDPVLVELQAGIIVKSTASCTWGKQEVLKVVFFREHQMSQTISTTRYTQLEYCA